MRVGTPESFKRIRAPAKLNIRLKITGRRSDGYHELVSIMVPVGLFDHLELESIPSGIILSCQGESVPVGEENLVSRAARAFFSQTGIRQGISIKLIKNIPVAAGLGGGSSDAAQTLRALNEMWSEPLTSQELKDLCVDLGADVPFFLQRRPCIARGIGEILEPIEGWPKLWYVIVSPPIEVSTAWVYRNLKIELTPDEYGYIIKTLQDKYFEITQILENDLETVTASHYPAIYEIKEHLLDAGAGGALMSGSGPSVFGIFTSKDRALLAKNSIISRNLGTVFAVDGIT